MTAEDARIDLFLWRVKAHHLVKGLLVYPRLVSAVSGGALFETKRMSFSTENLYVFPGLKTDNFCESYG